MFTQIFLKFMIVISVVYCAKVSKAPKTTTPVDISDTSNEIEICADLKPDYISSRNGFTQTLDCSATICGGSVEDNNPVEFYQPIFDWNSQFGHIKIANGTCDYAKLKCWHSINIDIGYFVDEMLDNGLNQIQFSCYVSDSFATNNGESLQFATGSDFSYLKLFKGRRIDENCENDSQCGENMFCLKSATSKGTVCQCSIDFLTGVQLVEVMDEKYQELVCVPPVMINGSCSFDQQCQAMDPNSFCATQSFSDSNANNKGKCECIADMVYHKQSCQSFTKSTKSPVIWWIFTSDYDNHNNNDAFRFFSLRNATYVMAVLAISLPLILILISMLILCYRRLYRERQRQKLVKTMFPSPRLRINDLCTSKDKSDDKYDLVKNDQLEKNMA